MKNATHTIAPLAALYCLTLIMVLAFGIYKVSVLGAEYEMSLTVLAEQQAKEQAYYDLQQVVEATKAQRETLASFFITEKDTIRFIASMEELARSRGLSLETTQLAVDPKTENKNAMLKIGFTYQGSEQAVKSMTSLFETIPYHKTIPEFEFRRSEEGMWEGRIALHITIAS